MTGNPTARVKSLGLLSIWIDMNDTNARPSARAARRGVAVVLLALLAPQGTLLLLRAVPTLDLVLRSAVAHLVVVSAISACALAVAVAAAGAAGRSRDGSLVLLALGCLAVGGLMLGHGLLTPGIGGRPANLWVGRLPVLAITAFAGCLCAAAWPQRPPAAWAGRWPRGTLAAGGAALALALVGVSLWPAAGVGGRPVPGEAPIRLALVLAAAIVLVAVGVVHWWRWRLGFDLMQLALVVACLLGAGALLSLQVGALWHLSWWDYHAFLLTGFAAAIYAVLTSCRRSSTLQEVLGGVFAADPMAHISRGYSETLRALIGAVEARDAYTHGHSARVAELSVHLGLRLGLRPAALRTLAEGAYLHDVGKVGIPDHHPEQARWPYRRGAGLDPTAPDRGLRHRRPGTLAARRLGSDPPAPRALRRPGLPRRPCRAADLAGRPDRGRGRRVGCAHLRPRLPACLATRPCTAALGGRARQPLRPGLSGRIPGPDGRAGPSPRPWGGRRRRGRRGRRGLPRRPQGGRPGCDPTSTRPTVRPHIPCGASQ